MRYGQLRQYDIANGEGIRTVLFVTGCTHHCPECFNVEYQDFTAGELFTAETLDTVLSYVSSPQVAGLTLLGGEPFQNVEGLLPVVQAVREKCPDKTIWAYSGYTYEEILEDPDRTALLDYCDVLVDGRYVDALRDPGLAFRGSKNQRIIDVPTSRAQGCVVWHPRFAEA